MNDDLDYLINGYWLEPAWKAGLYDLLGRTEPASDGNGPS